MRNPASVLLALHSWHHSAATTPLCGFGNSVGLLSDHLPRHTMQIFFLLLCILTQESGDSDSSQIPPGEGTKYYALESPNIPGRFIIPPSDQSAWLRLRLKGSSQEPTDVFAFLSDLPTPSHRIHPFEAIEQRKLCLT